MHRKSLRKKNGTTDSQQMMEGTTLVLPKIKDWTPSIGDLWNCRTSERVFSGEGADSSKNIFITDQINKEEFLELVPTPDMKYTLSRARDANGKAEILDVSVEVKIELPSFTVEGGVSFSKENTKDFEEDEFFCQYNLQTQACRVRPSVLDENNDKVFDKGVMEEIMDGSVATHYISEIRYGAHATGTFRLSKTIEHDKLDLSGYVGGTVPVFAGVSMGLKASIGFMQANNHIRLSRDIEIIAAPPLPPPSGLKITDMFDQIETLPSEIKPIDNDPNKFPFGRIRGAPISFKLSPLTSLIDMSQENESYPLLETLLLQQMTELILHLHNYKFEDTYHYISLLREVDFRLTIIFRNPPPSKRREAGFNRNPYSSRIAQFQVELQKKALAFSDRAVDLLTSHKKGEVSSVEGMEQLLDEFTASILHPTKIRESVLRDVEEGRTILNFLRVKDAALSGELELFEFDETEWETLQFINEGKNSLLISCDISDVTEEFKSSVLLRVYKICASLKEHYSLQTKVASPNISTKGFWLGLKLGDLGIKTYKNDELLGVISLLEALVDLKAKRVKGSVSQGARFVSIWSSVSGYGNPREWSLHDIFEGPKFSNLQKDFKNMNLTICDTYLQTLEALLDKEEEEKVEWTFLLFPQFLYSAEDCIFLFKTFLIMLNESKNNGNIDFRTTVGSFDKISDAKEGPLLIILDKFGDPVGVCFDKLDILLLAHILSESDKNHDFTPISFESAEKNALFSAKAFQTCEEVIGILTGNRITSSSKSEGRRSPFLLPTKETRISQEEDFVDIHNLFHAATNFLPVRNLISITCLKVVEKFGGKYEAILNKNSWSRERGFYAAEGDPDWSELKTSLEEIEIPEDVPEDDKIYFEALTHSLDYGGDDTNFHELQQTCRIFVEKYFEPLTSHPIDGTLFKTIMEKVNEINRGEVSTILEILGLLRFLPYNEKFLKLSLLFEENLLSIYKADQFLNFSNALANEGEAFTQEEKQWVWGNLKVGAWAAQHANSESILAPIYLDFCRPLKTVPWWLPKTMRGELIRLHKKLLSPEIEWIDTWGDIDRAMCSFKLLASSRMLPTNFMEILLTEVHDFPEIRKEMREKGVLFYWKEDDGGYFEEAWGLDTIRKAFEILSGKVQEVVEEKGLKTLKFSKTHLSKRSQEESIFLVDKWWPFTGGKVRKINFSSLLNADPSLITNAPFLLLDPSVLVSAGERILSHIFHHFRQGLVSFPLVSEETFQYIDYKIHQNDLAGLVKGKTGEGQVGQTVFPFSFLFSPSLSCFGGSYSSYRPLEQFENGDRRRFHDNDNEESDNILPNFFLSSSDVITLLITCCDPSIKSLVLKEMAKDSMHLRSLPWIIPNITSEREEVKPFLSLSSYLRDVDLKHFYPGSLFDTKIFGKGYKLITALRIGGIRTPPPAIGKSTLLNEALLTRGKFSSKFEPGFQNGLPLERSGLVEVTWLSESTVKVPFDEQLRKHFAGYSREVLLVSNLHGDALSEVPQALLKSLAQESGALLIFWDCPNWNELEERRGELEKVLGERFKSVPLYNIVLNPDDTIKKWVDDGMIIETKERSGYSLKIQNAFLKVLNKMEKGNFEAISGVEEWRKLLEFVSLHGVSKVRRGLWKQNGFTEENLDNDVKGIRDTVLSQFLEILNLDDKTEQLWLLENGLVEISEREIENQALNTKNLLNSKYLSQLSSHNISLNSLSISNILRELILDGREIIPGLEETFLSSMPLELINLSFYEGIPLQIQNCLYSLESLDESRVLTISCFGVESYSVLREILGTAFISKNTFSTGGITAQLFQVPSDLSFDFIMFLSCETLLKSGETFEGDSLLNQRQLATFLLSVSDVSFLSLGGNSDDGKGLQGLLEMSFLSMVTLFPERKIPELFVTSSFSEESNSLQFSQIFRQTLEQVEMLCQSYIVETGNQESLLSKGYSLYARLLADELAHFIPSSDEKTFPSLVNNLRRKVFSFSPSEIKFQASTFINNWEVIKANTFSYLLLQDTSSYLETLTYEATMSKFYSCFENVYDVHESLLTSISGAPDFDTILGIPFFCKYVLDGENVCSCENEKITLSELEEEIRHSPTVGESLQNFEAQLRADLLSRVLQNWSCLQLQKGIRNEDLHKKLDELLSGGDPYPWGPFKQYVSKSLRVPNWVPLIMEEVTKEYGERFLTLVEESDDQDDGSYPFSDKAAFDTSHLLEWGLSPLEESGRESQLGKGLHWEESVWLEVIVQTKVFDVSFSQNGYKRGMLRKLKQGVNEIMNEDFKTLINVSIDWEVLPSFVQNVHLQAVKSFMNYWDLEWNKWKRDKDPLKILEERKEAFPDIFV